MSRLIAALAGLAIASVLALSLSACEAEPAPDSSAQSKAAPPDSSALKEILDNARRVPNHTGWFEILKLPNDVYALWEPGHTEKVNSFLILGETRDLLYDTGMGIGNIRMAIDDIRAAEQLPERPLMVVLSHNHLDHNGGVSAFQEVWTADDPWAVDKLTEGLPGGPDAGFVPYWSDLAPESGVVPPSSFDPLTHGAAPFPRGGIHFLADGDRIDLGGRVFTVIRTTSHSPDGVVLYDAQSELFFGGDTFYGPDYLVTDLEPLAHDLERVRNLPVQWHYSSHGSQLVEVMKHGAHLAVVREMIAGRGTHDTTRFADLDLPRIELDGVTVTLAGDLLVY